jgi:Nucleotidyl transferase AbiEii toxin, Type IV TA system
LSREDADSVNRQLQRLAREHHARNTQALQILYAIEGFLRRLSISRYREQLVLKGAMLLAVLDARRMTKDADLSAHGIPNDEQSVTTVVAEIATSSLSESDGVLFDPSSIATEAVREGASYRGVRAKLPAQIGAARVVVTLDFSFGDPGEVEEILYPEILGGAGIALRAYPIERTLAEKIATMMERGELNTRDRDFADVWVLSRLHTIDARSLSKTLQAVVKHRNHRLLVLSEALAELPNRQQSYDALRGRASFTVEPPSNWDELVAEVIAFVDPLTHEDGAASLMEPSNVPVDLTRRAAGPGPGLFLKRSSM